MKRALFLAAAALLTACTSAEIPVAKSVAVPTAAAAAMTTEAPKAESPGGEPATASKRSLTIEGAREAIAGAVLAARKAHATGVVAVVDEGGNLMALERLDGTFAAGANISIGKARTAVLFKKPTRFFEEIIKSGRTPMIALNDFTPLQGGIPIIVDGSVVGGVGVSGASSAAQDEELAIAGANAVPGATPIALPMAQSTKPFPTAPLLIPNATVSAAFQKGSPLIEVDGVKIHASRRDKPGQVEIHTKDADLLYILGGQATFVTGGKAIDAKTIEPDELRGTSIEGGETQHLQKGDVVIVPKGVPHWFKEVQGTLLYYTVKVAR